MRITFKITLNKKRLSTFFIHMKDPENISGKSSKRKLGGSLLFSSSPIILHPSSLFHHFLENKENFLNKIKLNKKKLKQSLQLNSYHPTFSLSLLFATSIALIVLFKRLLNVCAFNPKFNFVCSTPSFKTLLMNISCSFLNLP
jgi:hypothetical protein